MSSQSILFCFKLHFDLILNCNRTLGYGRRIYNVFREEYVLKHTS